jgi:DDE superfamily endonuclease
MTSEPYASAKRVFWVVDNGSSHAGQASIERLEGRWENLRLIHLPVHASWLNQVELYFSIVQRKALTPNDLGSLEELAERLIAFGERYRAIAEPCEWTFTRSDLERVLDRVEAPAAPTEPGGAHLRLAA